jgi:hypothetical protein
MKKWLLSLAVICGIVEVQAQTQRTCGFELVQKILRENPAYQANWDEYQARMTAEANNLANKTTAKVTIPVVFHIVLTNAQQTQLGGTNGIIARVQSQVKVLNRDYQKQNADIATVPVAFQGAIGNAEYEFCLAHTDPNGNYSNGYEIITTGKSGFDIENGTVGSTYFCSDVKYNSSGGANAWNPTKYFNVWICNITPNGLLGVATPPNFFPGFPNAEQGAVINYGAFGSKTDAGVQGYFIPDITGGRTLVHETGHYFNLLHIWGDDDDVSGSNNCSGSDDVNDTPNQSDRNYGCPVFPKTDVCSPNSPGIMFMNYMDYVDDACMKMFTAGQVNRMRATLTNSGGRSGLIANTQLCNAPVGLNDLVYETGIACYPNPAKNTLHIQFNRGAEGIQRFELSDVLGKTIQSIPVSNTPNAGYALDVSTVADGVYFLKCHFDRGTITEKIVIAK